MQIPKQLPGEVYFKYLPDKVKILFKENVEKSKNFEEYNSRTFVSFQQYMQSSFCWEGSENICFTFWIELSRCDTIEDIFLVCKEHNVSTKSVKPKKTKYLFS